jgi:hypothetical protein
MKGWRFATPSLVQLPSQRLDGCWRGFGGKKTEEGSRRGKKGMLPDFFHKSKRLTRVLITSV